MTVASGPSFLAPASRIVAPSAPVPAGVPSRPLTLPGLELPSGCVLVKPAGATLIAICQPPPDPVWEKLLIAVPALVLSIFAIVISLRTFFYNQRKDERARAQSIQDDYWLRKVVSPLSIEPFLKFANEVSTRLPTASASKTAVGDHWAEQVAKLGEFSVAFQALGLIDPKLSTAVADQLSYFEDALADYCGHLLKHLSADGPAPDKAVAVQGLLATTLAILRLIQAHQTKVGAA